MTSLASVRTTTPLAAHTSTSLFASDQGHQELSLKKTIRMTFNHRVRPQAARRIGRYTSTVLLAAFAVSVLWSAQALGRTVPKKSSGAQTQSFRRQLNQY